MNVMDHDEIVRLTEEYGNAWGINHVRRLLSLVSLIDEGMDYDREALWIAVHLHDWGAYASFVQKEVDHVVRSGEVAEAFLSERGCPEETKIRILDCIARHHSPGADFAPEALLLRDADVLDFLGPVGVLRDFSKNPKDMRAAFDVVKKRRTKLPDYLVIPRAREIAVGRLQVMDALLAGFETDSFGYF